MPKDVQTWEERQGYRHGQEDAVAGSPFNPKVYLCGPEYAYGYRSGFLRGGGEQRQERA